MQKKVQDNKGEGKVCLGTGVVVSKLGYTLESFECSVISDRLNYYICG